MFKSYRVSVRPLTIKGLSCSSGSSPGMAAIERSVRIDARQSSLSREIPAFDVKPGETTRVSIGGVGRPIIGHVAIPQELKAKWSVLQPTGRITFGPKFPRPYDELTDREEPVRS